MYYILCVCICIYLWLLDVHIIKTTDRSTQQAGSIPGNYTFSNTSNEKFTKGHNNVLYQVQKTLNETNQSISIMNNDDNLAELQQNGVVSVMLEGFKAGKSELNELKELADAGIVVEAHVYAQGDNKCENIINSLSCYLMVAQKYSYYACSQGWVIDGWPDHEEYHKPLGKPMGNAAVNGDVYTRKFEGNGDKMTTVEWNSKTLLGKITWADGTVQVGKNGSQV